MRGATAQDAEELGWPAPALAVVRGVHHLSAVLFALAGVVLFIMLFLTVADVTRRKFFGGSIPGALELGEVGLVAIVFGGMMQAEVGRVHVRTPILTARLPARPANALRFLGLSIASALLAWMALLTWQSGLESMREGESQFGLIAVPVWPAKLIIPIGLTGMAIEHVLELVVTGHRFVRNAGQPPMEEQQLAAAHVPADPDDTQHGGDAL